MKLEMEKKSSGELIKVKIQVSSGMRPIEFNLRPHEVQMVIRLLNAAAAADSFAFATTLEH